MIYYGQPSRAAYLTKEIWRIQIISEYTIGKILLLRNAYGAVVDHIEPYHLQKTVIPILKNKKIQDKINDLVLEANDLRYQAHQKEQEAISMMNDILINRKN